MLPGLAPSVPISAAEGVGSFSFVGSGSGTTSTITLTTAGVLAADDLCIIFNGATNSSATIPTAVTPTGFTLLRNSGVSAASSIRGVISAKKLLGSETTVTGMTSTTSRWIVLVFRPSSAWTDWTDNNTGNVESTISDPVSQTILIGSAASLPAIAYGQMHATGGSITTRTHSPAMDEVLGSSTNHYAHYKLYNPGGSPVNNSYDTTDVGSQTLQSGYLVIT